MKRKNLSDKIIGRIAVNGNEGEFISRLAQTNQTASSLDAKEIIFCAGRLSYKEIIEQVQRLQHVRIRFFAGDSIVGSDDSTTKGEILSAEHEYNLSNSVNRRLKRLIDLAFSMISLLLFPIQFLLIKKPLSFFKNCFLVIAGSKTWIGYISKDPHLPVLKDGIIAPNGQTKESRSSLPEESIKLIDHWYARDYEPLQDLSIILKNYRYLGG